MKKLLMVLLMAMLVMALAACGDDKKDAEKAEGTNGTDNTEQAEGTTDNAEGSEDTAAVSGEMLDDEFSNNVLTILKDAGYEVEKVEAGETDFFVDTKAAMKADINGEDFLPLQVFEIDADSDSLKKAQETGLAPVEFEGEKVDYPGVLVIDNYYIFLAEGHPDQADIYKLLEEKLK